VTQPGAASRTPWLVAQTKSRQEKALATDLARLEIDHFLPLSRTVRYYGRRKFKVELPLFPGYVFLRADREAAIMADRTRRVVRLLPVADQSVLERQLGAIHDALVLGALLVGLPSIVPGESVEIAAGPFKGIRGVIHSAAQSGRLILNVDLIGRAAVLEIDTGLVRPI
jgi:transcription antitermination factor NusG